LENLSSRPNSRKVILKTAGGLFAKNGFRATTLRQISSKSGANGALVSYYFGNKEGLKDAVIQEKLESLQAVLSPLAAGPGYPASLSEAVRVIFKHIREDESFHLLAQRALVEDAELKRKMRSQLWDPLFSLLSTLIQKASGLKKSEADIRCLALCGMIQQYGNLLCFFRKDMPAGMPAEKTLIDFEEYVAGTVVADICGRH